MDASYTYYIETIITQVGMIEELEKFKELVSFIANDYYELSHDKAKWQRDDWKTRCKKLLKEYDERDNPSDR